MVNVYGNLTNLAATRSGTFSNDAIFVNASTILTIGAVPNFTNSTSSFVLGIDANVNGGYTDWSEVGTCNATATYHANGTLIPISGFRRFVRTCINPAPQNSGAQCSGPAEELRPCSAVSSVLNPNLAIQTVRFNTTAFNETRLRYYWFLSTAPVQNAVGFNVTFLSGSIKVGNAFMFVVLFILFRCRRTSRCFTTMAPTSVRFKPISAAARR